MDYSCCMGALPVVSMEALEGGLAPSPAPTRAVWLVLTVNALTLYESASRRERLATFAARRLCAVLPAPPLVAAAAAAVATADPASASAYGVVCGFLTSLQATSRRPALPLASTSGVMVEVATFRFDSPELERTWLQKLHQATSPSAPDATAHLAPAPVAVHGAVPTVSCAALPAALCGAPLGLPGIHVATPFVAYDAMHMNVDRTNAAARGPQVGPPSLSPQPPMPALMASLLAPTTATMGVVPPGVAPPLNPIAPASLGAAPGSVVALTAVLPLRVSSAPPPRGALAPPACSSAQLNSVLSGSLPLVPAPMLAGEVVGLEDPEEDDPIVAELAAAVADIID